MDRSVLAGTALVQDMRAWVSGIIAVKPQGDKATARMSVASAKIEAGQVLFPEQAAWLPDLEAEVFSFPSGRHDDQCDSISQALLDEGGSFIDWHNLLDEVRKMRPRRRH
jgi:predicted phage terminase large subunit-like protein